jgi:hypothetical protein
MFEILAVFAAVFIALGFVLFVAKLALALILLPIHIGFFIFKGVLLLVFAVPIVIVVIGVAALAVPIVLGVVGLPVLLFVGGIVLLVKLLT